MKGSEKKVSFLSPPIKSSSSPKGLDENDRSNQHKKTFMSPTISAASMVGFPRRKILGERNESPFSSNSFNAHFSKSPNLDSPKMIPKAVSHKISSPNQKTPLSSSPSPYDPLKNYLSPRPQFLRYNPDRRKEIFSRLEMEEDKEGDDTVSSEYSSSSSLESGDESESSLDEELSEEEVEEEEDEEVVTWSFRGISKYLLLFVVLILSTSYISSMNAPVDAPAFEGASVGFQNLSFGIVEGFDVGYKFLDLKQEQLVEDDFEEELIMVGEESEEFDDTIEFKEIEDVDDIEHIEFKEIEDVDDNEHIEFKEIEDVDDIEHIEFKEIEDVDDIEHIEFKEIEDVDDIEHIEFKEIEDVDDIEQMGQETGEEIEFLQVDHQASLLSERRDSSEEISMVEVPSEDFHKEILQVAVNILENWGESIALKFRELNLPKGLNQDMGTDVAILVFGLLTCAAIVASFVFGSSIRRNGNAPKQSSPADDKHSTKPVVESSSLHEPKKLDISNTVPLITTSAVPVGSRAPSVQLLAEFDVGGVKSAPINRRMKDDEVTISSSSHSYFSEQGFSQLLSAGKSNLSARSSAKKTQSRTRIGKNDLSGYEVMTPLRRSTRIRKCVASP